MPDSIWFCSCGLPVARCTLDGFAYSVFELCPELSKHYRRGNYRNIVLSSKGLINQRHGPEPLS